MIPDIEITCANKIYTVCEITVGKYKRYAELMKSSEIRGHEQIMFYNMKIIHEIFNHAMTMSQLQSCDISELMYTVKTIHFVIQDVITPMFQELGGNEVVEVEKSIFDDYDRENGYEEFEEQETNMWDSCISVIDMITKSAIRVLRNSYSQCLNTNIVELIKYLKYEIETINE